MTLYKEDTPESVGHRPGLVNSRSGFKREKRGGGVFFKWNPVSHLYYNSCCLRYSCCNNHQQLRVL